MKIEIESLPEKKQKDDRWFAVKIIAASTTAKGLRKKIAIGGDFEVVIRGKKFPICQKTNTTF